MKHTYIGSIAVLYPDGRLEAKAYGLKLEPPEDTDEETLKLYDECGRMAIDRKVQELRDETEAQVEYRITVVKGE